MNSSQHIGLDARMLQHTGIGTYLKGLIGGFESIKNEFIAPLWLYGSPESFRSNGFLRQDFNAQIYSVREQFEYPFRFKNCVLWHAPHYNIPLCKPGMKLIVTIHDMIHWIFRKDFFSPLQGAYADFMLRQAVKSADHVIAVSANTKKDLVEHLGANANKISVVYEASHEIFKKPVTQAEIQNVKDRYGLNAPYFLYVGMMKPHKNLRWLITTYLALRQRKKLNANLVILSKRNPKDEAWELLMRHDKKDGITHLENIPFEDFPSLYANALALVHPSLYEGFGLTLLEAMTAGTAVIAFATSSIPEVTGDAAILTPINDEEAFGSAMIQIQNDSRLRQALIQRAQQHVQKFSWLETARQTNALYRQVIQS